MKKVILFLVISFCFALPILAQDTDTIFFAPAVNYLAGNAPVYVFSADLDGDGDQDLVVANGWSDNVSILKNNGDGTFQSPVNYGVGDTPNSVFCADLDGDSDLDLATADLLSDSVSVLTNNGDGTFQPKVGYFVGYQPGHLACSDLDGDSDLDLAVAVGGIDSICVLKNGGNGIFQSPVYYEAGDIPSCVCCADLDKDGDQDLAVTNFNSNNVSIFENNGDGTFQDKVDYGAGNGPQRVAPGDLDGDGDLDLATANVWSGNVSILSNNSDGTFQPKVDYPAGSGAWSVFCADLDRDGYIDVITANAAGHSPDSVSILRNKGDGTFQPRVNYAVGSAPRSVFSADLDRDGDLDLATANQYSDNVSILKNLTNPLVGYWKFDEGVGDTAYDSSGYGNNGTLYGPSWVDGLPVLGKALDFDGADDYVRVANATSLQNLGPITVMTWVKSKGPTGSWHQVVCSKWYGESGEPIESFTFEILPDTIIPQLVIKNSTGTKTFAVSNQSLTRGQWTHIAGTYDGANIKIYVNGILTGSAPLSGPMNVGDQPLMIGKHTPWNPTYWTFNGTIDDVRLYGCALSPEEIRAEFESGFARGDANADSQRTVSDVVFLINYLFKGGPFPQPLPAGDANCDGQVTVSDVVYLINYLFKGGPPPGC